MAWAGEDRHGPEASYTKEICGTQISVIYQAKVQKRVPEKKSVVRKKPALAFGITTITSISNFSSRNVKLTNKENGQVANCPPEDTARSNVDIPWADDWVSLVNYKYLEVKAGGSAKYYIFQGHGRVYYATGLAKAAYDNRERVPGFSQGDGARNFSMNADETFEVES